MMAKRNAKELSEQRFGAHVSVAGGLHKAFAEGVRVGCDCIQIFVKNQRQWKAKPLTDEQIEAFVSARQETGIWPVIAHASYLVNLGTPNDEGRGRSVDAMVDELERCAALGVDGLVVHPGAHMGEGEAAGIQRIAESIDRIHKRTPDCGTPILLETTAGQGSAIGCEIAHFARILEGVMAPERLRICLDTCHLFAAGYDLRDPDLYSQMVDELAEAVGLDRVKCIHVNDAKNPLGSRIDRHEHIGKGKLGSKAFENLVNDARLASAPKILETPKGKDGRGADFDKVNLGRLRRMVGAGRDVG